MDPQSRELAHPRDSVSFCEVEPARRSGTVTFLFTNIDVSTRRNEGGAEAMRATLVAHDETLRAAIEAHGGWLFKHTGDEVCAAFDSARRHRRRGGSAASFGVAGAHACCHLARLSVAGMTISVRW
jgi:class 3 adenylate cyclase